MLIYTCVVVFVVLGSTLAEGIIPRFRDDYTYSEQNDAFYKLLPSPLNWYEAFTACIVQGSQMAFPQNPDEVEFLWKLLNASSAGGLLWVGASKDDPDRGFVTVNGEEISKTFFGASSPSGDSKGECVQMKEDKKLYKNSCFSKRRAVCKKSRPADPCSELHIAPGYAADPDRGSCYKLHPVPVTWDRARVTCENEGAHLVVLNSQREADYLVALSAIYKLDPKETVEYRHLVAVDFRDYDKEGVYRTVEGQHLKETGYADWNVHEPSDRNHSENCGSMWRNSGKLNDIFCYAPMKFICEKDIYLPIWNANN